MTTAVYPGSFDPVTNGHLDIICRASKMFDRLIIAVLNNNAKTPLFSTEERVTMLREITAHISNIEVESFDGLSIKYCHERNAQFMVRGLRAVTDFEYELQIAQTNRVIAPDIDTIFLTTNLKYSYLSSSIVKEIATYNGDISAFVDQRVAERIQQKIGEKHRRNE
ncbi:phosphopantetheine adenylyltransferase [Fusobacterium naviforme]|nr:pantetheine-phosphate adenylyltransferase [Fusobacterium naviforme]PSL10683.1 phosphopantetheine adenylyltransferase [Fusobacterium naviforme]STO27232.1 Phosphopantetheine adenylyltransferase [Fusobacterium naviforme]